MDLPGSDWGDFSCRRAVDSSSYILIPWHLGDLAVIIKKHEFQTSLRNTIFNTNGEITLRWTQLNLTNENQQ